MSGFHSDIILSVYHLMLFSPEERMCQLLYLEHKGGKTSIIQQYGENKLWLDNTAFI